MNALAATCHPIIRPEGGPPTSLHRGSGALAANLQRWLLVLAIGAVWLAGLLDEAAKRLRP